MIEALIDAVALRTHRSAKSAAEMTEFLLPWLVQPQATLPAANPSTHRPKNMTSPAIVAIHGGAGTILREAMDSDTERQYCAELTAILTAAQQVLADGGSALDAVTVAVRMLEDCPLFNAGAAPSIRRRASTNSTRR